MFLVKVCDTDGKARYDTETRGSFCKSRSNASIKDDASVQLIRENAHPVRGAGLLVVSRRSADLTLKAQFVR